MLYAIHRGPWLRVLCEGDFCESNGSMYSPTRVEKMPHATTPQAGKRDTLLSSLPCDQPLKFHLQLLLNFLMVGLNILGAILCENLARPVFKDHGDVAI